MVVVEVEEEEAAVVGEVAAFAEGEVEEEEVVVEGPAGASALGVGEAVDFVTSARSTSGTAASRTVGVLLLLGAGAVSLVPFAILVRRADEGQGWDPFVLVEVVASGLLLTPAPPCVSHAWSGWEPFSRGDATLHPPVPAISSPPFTYAPAAVRRARDQAHTCMHPPVQ
eukprot:Sspe_Gene.39847::Locus_19209_Transcript_1_1_Confidence_1.000_Length_1608::g.39847::m.39847